MIAPRRSGTRREQAIAQYVVTKVGWKGSYTRILVVTPTCVRTYNIETHVCTSQWELCEIEAVFAAHERDHFVIRLEKVRFRRANVRFHCTARTHILTLFATLQQHFAIARSTNTIDVQTAQTRFLPTFRCIECFADSSSQSFDLLVGVTAIVLLDDTSGHEVDTIPYMYLKRASSTTSHPDSFVLATAYRERLFLCSNSSSNRNECLSAIYAAAAALGVDLHWHESPLTAQLLRLRSMQLIEQPAIACFDVRTQSRSSMDSNVGDCGCFSNAQLVLQSDALVEVHAALHSVVAWPFAALQEVIRDEADTETVTLVFAAGEQLVVHVAAREQLIALLLLTCRESGYDHVVLTAHATPQHCVLYPLVRASTGAADATMTARIVLHRLLLHTSKHRNTIGGSNNTGVSAQRPLRLQRPRNDASNSNSAPRDSLAMRQSLSDTMNVRSAIDELNANVRLRSMQFEDRDSNALNDAVALLAEHLIVRVVAQRRRCKAAANADAVATLQALVRLSGSTHVVLSDALIPRFVDALQELLTQRDFLTSYWCLQLLQCYFDPVQIECVYGQRSKVLQYIATQRELLQVLVALLPSTPAQVQQPIGFWLIDSDGDALPRTRDAAMDVLLLPREDARLTNDMDAVVYEALCTIHYIAIYLYDNGQQPTSADGSDHTNGVHSAEAATAHVRQTNGSRSALRRASHATLVDVSPSVHATLQRFVATQLVAKHAFLMAAVVHTRLVRACLSCVALVKFVALVFGDDAVGDDANDDAQQAKVTALTAFLASHAAALLDPHCDESQRFDSHERTSPRSRYSMHGEHVHAVFSASIARASSASDDNDTRGTANENGFRMYAADPESVVNDAADGTDNVVNKDENWQVPRHSKRTLFNARNSQDAAATHIDVPTRQTRQSASHSLRMSHPSLPTTHPWPRTSLQEQEGHQQQEQQRSPPRPPLCCDACIGCNDVCHNVACFGCTEKSYQLELTFPDSPLSTQRVAASFDTNDSDNDDDDDRFAHIARQYSSCELRRHCSVRSCWVVVDNAVYDVTDLLSVHPGGLQVLLQAAQQGTDCSAILKEHPPSARRVLHNYRLGEYYKCDTRTSLP